MCGNPPRPPTAEELPACYNTSSPTMWQNVTLDEFIDCPYNLAHNRMTRLPFELLSQLKKRLRMFADLNLVHCYDTTAMSPADRDGTLLNSAKHNLQHNMAFFGLLEDMDTTQLMMEKVMGIRFSKAKSFFAIYTFITTLLLQSMSNWTVDKSSDTPVTDAQLQRIRQRVHLDMQLYSFARDLFQQRAEKLRLFE